MNPKKILLIGSAGLLMASCTYSPHITKTVNQYYGQKPSSGIAKMDTVQQLEFLNQEFDKILAQLK
jgi:hypothetical protein